jgi:hypothetical protein
MPHIHLHKEAHLRQIRGTEIWTTEDLGSSVQQIRILSRHKRKDIPNSEDGGPSQLMNLSIHPAYTSICQKAQYHPDETEKHSALRTNEVYRFDSSLRLRSLC